MNMFSKKKVLGLTMAVALGSFMLVGCDNANSKEVDMYDTSDGVAVTVGGHEIGEKFITAYIEEFRANQSLTTPESWGQWLVNFDSTPESVRTDIIDFYTDKELIKIAADEYEITVDETIIDSQIETMVSQYGSQEAWEEALTSQGISEDDYREMLHETILNQMLMEKVAPAKDVTDEQFIEAAGLFASAYDGAKKSSHILFAPGDKELATEVLGKIKSGEITFEDAVAQYSTDEGSKVNGGDVGWDKLSSFVPEYTAGLAPLEKGAVSDLVESDYGFHIIKCTDVFVAPEKVTSIDQIPEDFAKLIRSQLSEYQRQDDFMKWREEYKEKTEIIISDMPEGLPYDVDLTGIEKEEQPAPQPR